MALLTYPWNETTPAGTDGFNVVDDRIREMKQAIREVLAVNHGMTASGDDAAWGKHQKVTLPAQASAPTIITGTGIIYSKLVNGKAELFYIDEDGHVLQLTSVGNLLVTAANIPTASIIRAKIATGQIYPEHMSSAAILNAAIGSGEVDARCIADLNVTNAKIAGLAVTGSKIADDAVTTAKILDANVTSAKLVDGSIAGAKMSKTVVSSGSIFIAINTDWTPPAGVYQIIDSNYRRAVLMLVVSAAWQSDGTNGINGIYYFDGTNMKIHATDNTTVYYQKF